MAPLLEPDEFPCSRDQNARAQSLPPLPDSTHEELRTYIDGRPLIIDSNRRLTFEPNEDDRGGPLLVRLTAVFDRPGSSSFKLQLRIADHDDEGGDRFYSVRDISLGLVRTGRRSDEIMSGININDEHILFEGLTTNTRYVFSFGFEGAGIAALVPPLDFHGRRNSLKN